MVREDIRQDYVNKTGLDPEGYDQQWDYMEYLENKLLLLEEHYKQL